MLKLRTLGDHDERGPPPGIARLQPRCERALAQRALPRVFDFADGGAENEYTLRRNEATFSEMICCRSRSAARRARPLRRALRPASGAAGDDRPDRPLRPVLARRRDRRGAGRRGGRHGLLPQPWLDLHHRGSGRRGGAPRWMQIFVYRDRGFTREFVDRAAACGFDALVLTTDNQLSSIASAISATDSPSRRNSPPSTSRRWPASCPG